MAMVVLNVLSSAVQYFSTLLFGRLLAPARFGDLTALLVLAFVIAVPTAAAQTVVAERVAVLMVSGRMDRLAWFIRHAFAHVTTIALAVAAVYALCIPVAVEVLDLEVVSPAVAMVPYIVVSFVAPLALGVLQGMDRFVAFGLMTLVMAVGRIALGVPLLMLSGGAGAVIMAYAAASGLVILATLWLLRPYLIGRGTGAASAGVRKRLDFRAFTAGGAFIAFALLSNLDIVLAKLFLPRYEVGLYAALYTIGKVVIFLPSAIAVIMVPNAARARHSAGSGTRVLRIAAVLVALTALLAAVPAALRPSWVITTTFGAEYAGATSGILPMVCAGAGLALLNLLVVYSVAVADRRWVVLLILGVVLQVGGISLFHGSAAQIATVQATVVGAVLLINEIAFHPLLHSRRVLARGTA